MKTTPKDFFLHLGATIALYISAVTLVDLSFAIIDKVLPDSLNAYFSPDSIVWPISILIILVPVLYAIEWMIRRDVVAAPEKKEIWISRWSIYLTLFLTGTAIAIDLICLINSYLNGDASAPLLWEVLVVLVVAAIIFAYYLLAHLSYSRTKRMWQTALKWLGIILVLGAVIAGFVIVGSPAKRRAMRFDEQRITDLSNIQWYVVNDWQEEGKLPQSLSFLNDPSSSTVIPNDPETGKPYEYVPEVATSTSSYPQFSLCGNFSLSDTNPGSSNIPGAAPYQSYESDSPFARTESWTHSAGHVCFSRSIDPLKYPPSPKISPPKP